MRRSIRIVGRGGMVFLVFLMTFITVYVEVISINTDKKEELVEVKEPIVSAVGMGNNQELMEVGEIILADDARLLLIENYLRKYKSPLLPYSKLIIELSDSFGYDYRWIVAIAQQESNLCKKIPDNSYNCWGYGIHAKGTLRFESYDLALRSFATYLQKSYFDKGLNTPELVMKKYCPHSNGSWAYGVNQFFREIEAGK